MPFVQPVFVGRVLLLTRVATRCTKQHLYVISIYIYIHLRICIYYMYTEYIHYIFICIQGLVARLVAHLVLHSLFIKPNNIRFASWIDLRTHTCLYIYIYIYSCIRIYLCIHVYVYINAYTYIYIYMFVIAAPKLSPHAWC